MTKPNPPAGQVPAGAAEVERLREILVAADRELFESWSVEQMTSEPIGFLDRWRHASWVARWPLNPRMTRKQLVRFIVGFGVYESVALRLQASRDWSAGAWSAAVRGVLLLYSRVVPGVMALAGYPPVAPLHADPGRFGAPDGVDALVRAYRRWWEQYAHLPDLAGVLFPEPQEQSRWLDYALRRGRDIFGQEVRRRRSGQKAELVEGPWRVTRSVVAQLVVGATKLPRFFVFDRHGVPVVRASEALARDVRDALREGALPPIIPTRSLQVAASEAGTRLSDLVGDPRAHSRPSDADHARLSALDKLQQLDDLETLSGREREVWRLTRLLGLDGRHLGGREHARRLAELGFSISPPGLRKLWGRVIAKARAAG